MSIEACRLRAGKTIAEVSRELKVSRMAIWNWENGKAYPKTERLKELAVFLGVTVDELLKEEP